jgi:2-hydroxychromene-2-carboxylate isomerase
MEHYQTGTPLNWSTIQNGAPYKLAYGKYKPASLPFTSLHFAEGCACPLPVPGSGQIHDIALYHVSFTSDWGWSQREYPGAPILNLHGADPMSKIVDYYFTASSPWAFLGHARFSEIASRHNATVNHKPVDLINTIFPNSDGLPLKQRSPARQAYRLTELRRWSTFLGIGMNLQPAHFPSKTLTADYVITAAVVQGEDPTALIQGIMEALWIEEADIDDLAALREIAIRRGYNKLDFLEQSESPDVLARYEANTNEALERGVFGAPSYIIGDDLLWGQDRVDFVERILAA